MSQGGLAKRLPQITNTEEAVLKDSPHQLDRKDGNVYIIKVIWVC
jgi:hypothetical protein